MNRQFYTTEKLGPKQSLTPDGFLLCEDVPIARTGVQIYGPNETSITPGDDGLVYIMRPEEEVFRPETIASFNGKPVLNEHPQEGEAVTPDNWKRLSVGVVLNPHRGTGEHENHLLADMILCDPTVIELVRSGKREVSCGYSAEWYETGVGHGEQRDIIGNHVALVEHARCGSECSIGDRSHVNDCACEEGGLPMKWEDLKKKLMSALRAKDDVTFDAALAEAKKSGKAITIRITKDDDLEVSESSEPEEHRRTKFTDEALNGIFEKYDGMHAAHDRRHAVHDDRLKGHDNRIEQTEKDIKELQGTGDDSEGGLQNAKEVEGQLKFEAPPGTGDAAIRDAQDSSLLADAFSTALALGEVLVPGIQLPKFDRSKKLKTTFMDMCSFRRKALILGSKDQHTHMLMLEARNGHELSDGAIQDMNCGQVRDFFNAVGAMKKRMNNTTNTHSAAATAGSGPDRSRQSTSPRSLADVNRANKEKWGVKS